MIKLEISLTGAGQDEVRRLEDLMQKILTSLEPHMTGIEATVKQSVPVDPYAKTKAKILSVIERAGVSDRCMDEEFWLVYIQDWLNPKDKDNLRAALDSLCEEGMLEEGIEPWEYYLTRKGFHLIY
ncbi:hypothetical protein WN982_04270 [Paraburkholderia sp. IMGN_8]|uniref:hypothetical protein n=1 Tax=Paraburkholderia sp. IMGN_8 TaxID=3136564 RepID=UPI003100CEF9